MTKRIHKKLERRLDEVRNHSYKLQEKADLIDCRKAEDVKEDLAAWKEESEKLIDKTRLQMENHFETNISMAIERNATRIREELEKTWANKIAAW